MEIQTNKIIEAYHKPTINELQEIAAAIGLEIAWLPLKAHDGMIKGNRVAIRADLDADQAALVLAHEIAHAVLHRDKGDTIKSARHSEYEEQADRGAELLLLALAIGGSRPAAAAGQAEQEPQPA